MSKNSISALVNHVNDLVAQGWSVEMAVDGICEDYELDAFSERWLREYWKQHPSIISPTEMI